MKKLAKALSALLTLPLMIVIIVFCADLAIKIYTIISDNLIGAFILTIILYCFAKIFEILSKNMG